MERRKYTRQIWFKACSVEEVIRGSGLDIISGYQEAYLIITTSRFYFGVYGWSHFPYTDAPDNCANDMYLF